MSLVVESGLLQAFPYISSKTQNVDESLKGLFESSLGVLLGRRQSKKRQKPLLDKFQTELFTMMHQASDEGIKHFMESKAHQLNRFLITLFIASLQLFANERDPIGIIKLYAHHQQIKKNHYKKYFRQKQKTAKVISSVTEKDTYNLFHAVIKIDKNKFVNVLIWMRIELMELKRKEKETCLILLKLVMRLAPISVWQTHN
ncbi:hypothetical protein RFI_01460 [Reticulomyxa filosa]|uniref:Uncharacterized protein n=1 Tax=Reticulomyxa filosa TaxID=46433 RepID=X6PBV7_RETFI|nr:hypothetical protein RFI_01460 [Reticulomyxa filosa]|eukprot:ETO35603.1 hypothetical protein RFI_01460 [Reticulomyxa filosa]